MLDWSAVEQRGGIRSIRTEAAPNTQITTIRTPFEDYFAGHLTPAVIVSMNTVCVVVSFLA
jgi:hypothetical protein